MSKVTRILWLSSSAILGASFLEPAVATAVEIPSAQYITPVAIETSIDPLTTESYQNDAIEQVTSVEQLSDVRPTDWAYQALQNLVERYRCIAGYPDGTFRGNRAMTRYEFAAGLNACLESITQLIGNVNVSGLATREDLETLRRLMEQFSVELATLRGRVDSLEARTAELEANQFSTTTKLSGEAIFTATDVIGKGSENTPVLQQRIRLFLNTSFTGEDLLVTRLQMGNSQRLLTTSNNKGLDFGAPTSEGFQTYQVFGNTENNVVLDWLSYSFPIGSKLRVTLEATGGVFDDFTPTLNPFFESYDGGNGSLSTFAQRNPIYRLGGGQGIGLSYKPSSRWEFTAGYLASEGAIPNQSDGFFNGDYSALGQITWTPSERFGMAVTYNRAYFGSNRFGFDNGGGNLATGNFAFAGTALANAVGGGESVTSNSVGLQMTWRVSPRFNLSGWVGYTRVYLRDTDAKGDIWNGALALAFPDLGKKGNLGGLLVGVEPYLTNLEGQNDLFEKDLPLHVEAFYKYQLTDNISVTPGLIWLTAPNQDADNQDILIGTIRTTFNF
ncbi:MAG: iron uptake porin [Oscillatoriaceae bacterium SKW80]|nr:iron uptake porin [Oscillatoriaceae bacterium SKYG93]MCX8119910.1 iron uptake porin [Oscillatoriaceae bacterium SKW80]MDW8451843.1 iron uptake porin [Oscillatoriaceae cyanobacterium SKYGB_i_bin93]HIK27575.1 iron uptake porin [Oscillatoriaceae cyanobacterium M7585_C2015_266]